MLTNTQKLALYDFVVYTLQEELEAELLDSKPNWMESKDSIFLRSRLNHSKETLFFLTQNELWMKSIEELQLLLRTQGTLDNAMEEQS
ncbi:hypothetical protein CN918_30360 [Priestia megaterium]|nr:hypothetical protein CN918_30360 [Priestia megaterium]